MKKKDRSPGSTRSSLFLWCKLERSRTGAAEKWRDFRSLLVSREGTDQWSQCLPRKRCGSCVDLVTKCEEQTGEQGMPFVSVMWSVWEKDHRRGLTITRGKTSAVLPWPVFTGRSHNWRRADAGPARVTIDKAFDKYPHELGLGIDLVNAVRICVARLSLLHPGRNMIVIPTECDQLHNYFFNALYSVLNIF